jgi:acylphosphatase
VSQTVARTLVIKGRVQGVGFRYFALHHAQQLGVNGWVRNLGNGDVEVHAEGPLPQVEELVRRLHRGPSFAWVSQVVESPAAVEGVDSFTIRR